MLHLIFLTTLIKKFPIKYEGSITDLYLITQYTNGFKVTYDTFEESWHDNMIATLIYGFVPIKKDFFIAISYRKNNLYRNIEINCI